MYDQEEEETGAKKSEFSAPSRPPSSQRRKAASERSARKPLSEVKSSQLKKRKRTEKSHEDENVVMMNIDEKMEKKESGKDVFTFPASQSPSLGVSLSSLNDDREHNSKRKNQSATQSHKSTKRASAPTKKKPKIDSVTFPSSS